MNRPVKLGFASVQALVIAVALGAVARAGSPYLPLIGPPPLRMQAVKKPVTVSAAIEASPALTVTNAPAIATTNVVVAPPATNSPDVGLTSDTPALAEPANPTLSDSFTASVFTLPTPDLLGITPQMLATYFRPVRIGTNDTVIIPFPISFMPPLPQEIKSSHAEYIVK